MWTDRVYLEMLRILCLRYPVPGNGSHFDLFHDNEAFQVSIWHLEGTCSFHIVNLPAFKMLSKRAMLRSAHCLYWNSLRGRLISVLKVRLACFHSERA